ncbi:MAG TPA: hypothetical protein DDZ53_08965, partial [Firmicutes bacterium]|nr:hypothetical protein [Bacillota bacterium]
MEKIRQRSWLKLLCGFLLILFLTGGVLGRAEARSIQFTELNIDAEILTDGTLVITEQRTARFEGS